VFLHENAIRERGSAVVIAHRNRSLHDDRTGIDIFIDEVNRATGDLHAGGNGLRLRIDARKRRQQRRVNVHDAHRILGDELRGQQAHVAGQRDEIGPGVFEHAHDFCFMRCAVRKRAVIDDECGQAERSRALDSRRLRPVRDHADDLRIEAAPRDRLVNRFEVRAAAGKENCQAHMQGIRLIVANGWRLAFTKRTGSNPRPSPSPRARAARTRRRS
jgi:hypothetical protein